MLISINNLVFIDVNANEQGESYGASDEYYQYGHDEPHPEFGCMANEMTIVYLPAVS